MPTALVAGATGILGRGVVFELAKHPETWKTIYALSRSQKEPYPDTVKHGRVDLTEDPHEIAKQLQGVEADYLFFCAYLLKTDEAEQAKVNGALLKNFLDALTITGAEKKLKRVLLVTGGKYYGTHFGIIKQPCEESDPRVEGPEYPPNFYYVQQDILMEAAKGKNWDWVVTQPGAVIGLAKNNFMNVGTPIALYASICKELGEDLIFPGNEDFYMTWDTCTSSKLHAKFMTWAALEPKCSNQNFNVTDGEAVSWQSLWPKIAAHFGLTIPPDQFARPAPLPARFELPFPPPIAKDAHRMGLVGSKYIKQGENIQRVDLVRWAQRPEVAQAWKRLVEREGLDEGAFGSATWFFMGVLFGRNYGQVMSMSKARKFGWTGYCDTWDALQDTFDELEKEKIIPKHHT